ncbi:MAG: right-handed parallel beta-helix repeat-containing protein [Candidatus Bathyarchaeia archaeon]
MKNKMRVLASILVIVFSLFIFPLDMPFPTVKATYVEGEIVIDTVWTLVDSPFILSGNVTIREGVTLTVESGVEIRFGGNFSLIVNGRLIANGTKSRPIIFTSNKDIPEHGDWRTLYFNGTGQPPSSLENCIIEYGSSGVTIAGGGLTIQSSVIRFNSENGVTALNGSITVGRGNLIFNNTASGIYVFGGNIIVEANAIEANEDGITLAGNLTTFEISIIKNNVSCNRKSGISLVMEDYNPNYVVIRNNTVSLNYYGLYIATNASTLITRNYITSNEVGVFYEFGHGHEAHFNDIFDNGLGMDVSAIASVNATRNYWGDPSGPYHASLNPNGKGNPVGGDGVNLDFIFFLTAPIDYVNSLPIAVLWADKIKVAPGDEVAFVGFESSDDGRVDQYYYSFGDGHDTGWTTLSIFFHNYATIGNYIARLQVMDDFGEVSSPASVTIYVVNLSSLNVELILGNNKVLSGGEIPIVARVFQGENPVGDANITFFSIKGGSFEPRSGLTNSSGYFTASFRAPSVSEITDIRVIARASKSGFADGSCHQYLTILPPLSVMVKAQPSRVLSGENSTISVYVSWVGNPIEGANVTISSTNGGSFTESSKLTDSNGEASFNFVAPQTSEEIITTIVANVSKVGFVGGEGRTNITVAPKMFQMVITANRDTTVSEETVTITVHVEHNGVYVQEANVTLSATAGTISPLYNSTDSYGNAIFRFTTPPVPEETNITITATVSKEGFATNATSLTLTARPGILIIGVTMGAYSVPSESPIEIYVYVICNGRAVAAANVTVALSAGTPALQSKLTDANGYCVFSILTPKTNAAMDLVVAVNAEKFGYTCQPIYVLLTVVPPAGGIPWLTILLVLIPVLLVVLIAVLVKLGVIQVSFGGEEEEE